VYVRQLYAAALIVGWPVRDLIPGEVRLFDALSAAEARAWIGG
jgi:hypothetical protein